MIVIILVFVALLLLGLPISVSIGVSAIAGCLYMGYDLVIIGQQMVNGIDSFLLIAIPLFIMAGNLMNAGNITAKIFDTAKALVGWIPGGLGHANVVASVVFAGMSGSAVADAGGLGTIEMEAMSSNGYDRDFSGAVTAASSVIGPIFPPSIPLVIYGSVASVSVAKLFMGGIVPALIMSVLLMGIVYIYAVVRKYEKTPFNLRKFITQFVSSVPALLTPLIILSGFAFGWFTPTEASSIAVIYALLVSVFVYRSMDWKRFKKCLLDSAISSANTLFIIGTSTLFTYLMAMEGISRQMSSAILSLSANPAVILLLINLLLLILGMFMEPGAILTLMLPVLIPIAKDLGLDMVHFGVVIVLNLMIGQVTPPFGVCLFVIADCNKLKIESLYKAILPFLIPLILTLLLITYVPWLVTALPSALL